MPPFKKHVGPVMCSCGFTGNNANAWSGHLRSVPLGEPHYKVPFPTTVPTSADDMRELAGVPGGPRSAELGVAASPGSAPKTSSAWRQQQAKQDTYVPYTVLSETVRVPAILRIYYDAFRNLPGFQGSYTFSDFVTDSVMTLMELSGYELVLLRRDELPVDELGILSEEDRLKFLKKYTEGEEGEEGESDEPSEEG